ncbi:MAG: hypothetical protein K2X97_13290 [Mycobacteriaceae bacterium]|nr:hypothetical protein [Mycobacteriaceae bacterium]
MWLPGVAPSNRDGVHAIASRLPLVLTLIAVITLILIFLLIGSAVLPVEALLMNTLSLTAAFGAPAWVFQDSVREPLPHRPGHRDGPAVRRRKLELRPGIRQHLRQGRRDARENRCALCPSQPLQDPITALSGNGHEELTGNCPSADVQVNFTRTGD